MGTFAVYHRSLSSPTRDEIKSIEIITDNVAQAITWARDQDGGMQPGDRLPKQVAALQALVAAIAQQAAELDPDGQEAVDAVVAASRTLAEIVGRQLDRSALTED